MRGRRLIVGLLAVAGLAIVGQALWIPAKAVAAQVLLERAFQAGQGAASPVKAWPWADTWPVARLSAPRLGKRVIVLEGGSGEAMAFGPAHLSTTPQAGERGTAVFAAHRDTHFAFLGDLKPGDELQVERRDGQTVRFRVTGGRVARWDASGIVPRGPGHRLVLSTCWPIAAVTHGPLRYLVTAERVTS